MTDSMRSPGSRVAGRYELVRPLAKGGMASVHLGHDRVLDRPVAVKILHSNFAVDPVFVDRFRREAQAAGRLSHPRIVAVYDWGEHGDSYYITMEYAEGRTLARMLADGPASFVDAVGITIDVLDALGAAHGRGLVHRDIKPANLIVGPTGTKVADFGITRAYKGDIDATDVGSVIGTASYMSPEQAQGLAVDPRSDLYSVGVVLFEMVAGRKPFVADFPVAIAYQHIDEAPPKASTFRPSVPPELEATIDRLLEKAPDDRFSSAAEVRDHLHRLRLSRVLGSPRGTSDDTSDDTADATGAAPRTGAGAQTRTDDESVAGGNRRRGLSLAALALLVAAAVAAALLVTVASPVDRGGTDAADSSDPGDIGNGSDIGDTVPAGPETSKAETPDGSTPSVETP